MPKISTHRIDEALENTFSDAEQSGVCKDIPPAILVRVMRDGARLSASRSEMNSEEKPSARAKVRAVSTKVYAADLGLEIGGLGEILASR